MPASDSSVLVVGSSNTDLVVRTDRLPAPGETVLGGTFFTAPGGKGANQAVAAARAGARTTFIARVGDDEFGAQALEGFTGEGLDTTYTLSDPDLPSGVALIVVDARGENSIVVASGANAALSPVQLDSAAPAFDRADVCLLQLETPLPTVVHAIHLAHEREIPVVLNPAPAAALPPDALSGLYLITPNESETEALTGIRPDDDDRARRAAQVLLDEGVRNVAITLGPRGAFLAGEEGAVGVPAPPVEAVDTTAAGDAFNGALACALGERRPLVDAIRFANCAGSLAVTRLGARPSLPGREDIEAALTGMSDIST